jgi:rod shape-determining protein MreC
VYDKTVRRRRAVLGLLVALSLILLTAYFGEAVGGGLHDVQRGFLAVVAPIQDGASRALKPVRDLFGWFGDTLDAKGQRDSLRRQVRDLRRERIQNVAAVRQLAELQKIMGLDNQLSLANYRPLTARVIGASPTVWYSTVNVDRGSNDGVRVDQPVIDGDGLVGKVTFATTDASVVTLITDHTSGVSAKVNESGALGVVQPAVGNPNDLLMQYLQQGDNVKVGDNVVTAGTTSGRLDSVFPPGIPIGVVTRVDQQDLFKGVHIRPFATLRQLDYVQILVRTGGRGPHP